MILSKLGCHLGFYINQWTGHSQELQKPWFAMFHAVIMSSCLKISAGVDGGLSGGSSVRRPGSEDPHNLFIILKHILKGLHLSSISIWKYLIWFIKLRHKCFLAMVQSLAMVACNSERGIANYCIRSAISGFPYPINYEACPHWYPILLFRDRLVLAFLAQIEQESSEPSCLICKWPDNSSNMWKHLPQGVHLSPISIWKHLTWLINQWLGTKFYYNEDINQWQGNLTGFRLSMSSWWGLSWLLTTHVDMICLRSSGYECPVTKLHGRRISHCHFSECLPCPCTKNFRQCDLLSHYIVSRLSKTQIDLRFIYFKI